MIQIPPVTRRAPRSPKPTGVYHKGFTITGSAQESTPRTTGEGQMTRTGSCSRLGRRPGAAVASLVLLLATAACDALFTTDDDVADNALVVVTGTSPGPLEIILSNQFLPVQDAQSSDITFALLDADTLVLSPPISETYPMGPNLRYFVRVTNPDTASTADLNIRVLLDGKDEVYNVNVSLKNSSTEYTYTYY